MVMVNTYASGATEDEDEDDEGDDEEEGDGKGTQWNDHSFHIVEKEEPYTEDVIVNKSTTESTGEDVGVRMVRNGSVVDDKVDEGDFGFCMRVLERYSSFLVKYPSVMIVTTIVIIVLSLVLAIVSSAGGKGLPDFSEPTKGYEARGTDVGMKRFIVRNFRNVFHNSELVPYKLRRLRTRRSISSDINVVEEAPGESVEKVLSRWRRLVGSASSLLNMDGFIDRFKMVYERADQGNLFDDLHLVNVCRWYKTQVLSPTERQRMPDSEYAIDVHHIPNYIAILNGLQDCDEVNRTHIEAFMVILRACASHYRNNSLYTCMKCRNDPCVVECGTVPEVCKSDVRLSRRLMVALLHNVFHYLADSGLQDDPSMLRWTASATDVDYSDSEYFKSLYQRKLKELENTRYAGIRVAAFNIRFLKFDLFSTEIISQSTLLIIAVIIVIVCGWIFSGSLFLGLLTLGCIIAAMLIAMFVYNRVFDMPFFPFLNITILIFIIGIGADDVFVYTGEWEQAKRALVLRDEKETEKFMIRWTMLTLKHAAVSMFVTSLTTAAAFYANISSDVVAVKCFGLFSGTAIIINYLLMITLFPCCVVVHEKYFSRCMNCCCPCCCTRLPVVYPEGVDVLETHQNKYNYCKQRLASVSTAFFNKHLPRLLIFSPLRFVLLLLFLVLGVVGIVVSFGKPGLNPPTSSSFQMFASSSSIEQYDLFIKKKFDAGLADDGRDVSVDFVFGVVLADNADHFDPEHEGWLVFKPGELPLAANRLWLRQFCANLKNAHFYVKSPTCDLIDSFFQKLTTTCSGGSLLCCGVDLEDYREEVFMFCLNKLAETIPTHYTYYQPLYQSAGNNTYILKTLVIKAKTTYQTSAVYQKSQKVVDEMNAWTNNQMKNASGSFAGFWMVDRDWQLQFYDLQSALFVGTEISLGIAIAVAFLVILATSLNAILSLFSVITILFIISVTVGILVAAGWKLNIVESTVFSVAAGLSADFTLHYSIAYRSSIFQGDRRKRTEDALSRMGPPIFMGALTTFVSGLVMYPATVLAYQQFGTFLMVVMFVSWLYSTFFFLPLCTVLGPTNNLGQISSNCSQSQNKTKLRQEDQEEEGSINL